MSNPYTSAVAAAIAEDANRGSWTKSQWRAYFLESTSGTVEYRLTSTGVMNLLGPTRGAEVLTGLKAASPEVHQLMQPSEGGLNVGHADAPAFLAGLVSASIATQAEVDAIQALATVTQPRHQLLGLPDPMERYF